MAASFEDLTAKVDAGERLTNEDMRVLASTRDIITLGMLASTVRRRLRGNEVTYVRVADLKVSTTNDLEPRTVPDTAGETRIFQTPLTLDAAISVVEKARDLAGAAPLSAFCL